MTRNNGLVHFKTLRLMKTLKLFSKQLFVTGGNQKEYIVNTNQADLSFILKVRIIAVFWFVCMALACGVAFF